MKDKITDSLKEFGLPRLIITGFLLLLLILAPFVGADLPTQISNIINRWYIRAAVLTSACRSE